MSGLVDALVITAVAGLVIARQFRASRLDTDRRWWMLPVVLAVVALHDPGLTDAHHPAVSALLLAAEILIGLLTGAGWAWTTRVWAGEDGSVWSKGGGAGAVVRGVGIALRAALYGAGVALGVRQDSSALLLALAGTLLVRSGILVWRARSSRSPGTPGPAYGAAVSRTTRKEPA